jgi:hypothetical protein
LGESVKFSTKTRLIENCVVRNLILHLAFRNSQHTFHNRAVGCTAWRVASNDCGVRITSGDSFFESMQSCRGNPALPEIAGQDILLQEFTARHVD